MNTISKFYLNKAKYLAVDAQGQEIELEVDYWNSTFQVSAHNPELEAYAARLLNKKHQVNFVSKMYEAEDRKK